MIYFCADDYGISESSNRRIEECLQRGVLNRVSVLPNGDAGELAQRPALSCAQLSLHINLVEGRPLSDVPMLTAENGSFRHSFIGLFFQSLFGNRKMLKAQVYQELQAQIRFWKAQQGAGVPLYLDSHQHTHMIPLVFQTLLQVIRDEAVEVASLRFPAEPLMPYICTPSLYGTYSITGLIKQWLLKMLGFVNASALKRSGIKYSYFMGVLFSGKLTEDKIKKILPHYLKLGEKHGKDIEIALHPGYIEADEELVAGCREDFLKFYHSPWRKAEYETLLNFEL